MFNLNFKMMSILSNEGQMLQYAIWLSNYVTVSDCVIEKTIKINKSENMSLQEPSRVTHRRVAASVDVSSPSIL